DLRLELSKSVLDPDFELVPKSPRRWGHDSSRCRADLHPFVTLHTSGWDSISLTNGDSSLLFSQFLWPRSPEGPPPGPVIHRRMCPLAIGGAEIRGWPLMQPRRRHDLEYRSFDG